jgi:branched-chain amino acid transport system substrate-binding protein
MSARLAAQMAVDELNASGGVVIAGIQHRVTLVDREIANRPEAAAEAARLLIARDSVDVLIGPQSGALAMAAGAVAEASGVPLVAPMASSPEVTAGRAFVTRLTYRDADQGQILARFAFDSLSVRRAAALYADTSRYGRSIVEQFARSFATLGGRMTTSERYAGGDATHDSTLVVRVLAGSPHAILLPDFAVGDSSLLRRLREAGFRGRVLGSDAWDALALRGRAQISGSIIVGNWDGRSDRDGVRTFRNRWAARHLGERPRAAGAATYDAVRLMARAAEKSRAKSGRALVQALQTGSPFEGAFADYRFNGTGNPLRGATVLELRGDSLVFRATIERH